MDDEAIKNRVPERRRLDHELVDRERAELEAAGFKSWLEVPTDHPLLRPFVSSCPTFDED